MLGGFRNNTDLRNEFLIDDSLIFSVPYVGNIVSFPFVMIIQQCHRGERRNGEESSFLHNAARTAMDWFLALALTVAGFWMLSWWRTPSLPDAAPEWTLSSLDGETVSLSDYEGQTVVPRVFGQRGVVSRRTEIPRFRQFVNEHPDISTGNSG